MKQLLTQNKKAELLNSHFASKTNIQGVDDEVPFLDKKDNIFSELSNMNTSPIELSKIIRTIKKSNQSNCGVPAKFLSLIATPISFSLSRMYNNLFEIGHFPDIFKLAHITIAPFRYFPHYQNFLNQLCITGCCPTALKTVLYQKDRQHI